jgi:hypothetical protein
VEAALKTGGNGVEQPAVDPEMRHKDVFPQIREAVFPPAREGISGLSNKQLVVSQQEPPVCVLQGSRDLQHPLSQLAASALPPAQKVRDYDQECLFHFFPKKGDSNKHLFVRNAAK